MRHNEDIFITFDGLRLFEQWWLPEDKPKAVVIIVHGYGEHSGRYGHAAEYLTQNGYCVYAFDLRGHGRSEGKRAFVWSFGEYLIDLENFLSRIRKAEGRKPVFILGHSLGGTIATLFAITRKPDINGLILSGPFLKFTGDISPLLQNLALLLGPFFPKMPLFKRLNVYLISRDPEVVARYESDPLIYHGRTYVREAAEIIRAIKQIQAQMGTVSLPLIILHGTSDRLSEVEGSRQLYSRASSTDKTLKLYEGLYHEVLNEPQKMRVLADIVAWLDRHML